MPPKSAEERKIYNQQYYQLNKEKNKEKNKCIHNRVRSTCKDCGGASICEHKRQRSTCKECGGSSICEHNRQRSTCKDCGGSSICEHNRRRSKCKDCGGASICDHNRERSKCKDCGGGSICDHNRRRSRCKDCGGASICEHKRQRITCKDCNLTLCLINIQRSSISRMLKNTSLPKTQHTIEYLGCNSEYFMDYLQRKMTCEMTFNNIHIDHIKPVSLFNLENEEDFLDCCHYTNLQPLLAVDNLEKSNKWNAECEIFWNENIKGKEYMEIYNPL